MSLTVVSVADRQETLPRIEQWYLEEWPGWYGPSGPGDARLDLTACLADPACLPSCLVALDAAAEPVGTVSLRTSSPGSDRYPGAWLTGLLVPPHKRRLGVGSRLVEAAEQEAGRLGFGEIHATTGAARSLLERRDWQCIDSMETRTGSLEIFRKSLGR
ncbi:GNAT family N-acetyltransferase [Roseibium sp.]|uniref:GNAT family N-acetyltransferase n=1 Tax=Roseibium sp. TaxID=1936156 RepID=UPI003D0DCBC2